MNDELNRVRARIADVAGSIQAIKDMTFGTVRNIGPSTELEVTPDSLTPGMVVRLMELEAEMERLQRREEELLK